MTLPIAFLLGLLVVVAHRELGDALPGEATADGLVVAASFLVVPALLALAARGAVWRELLSARPAPIPPRALWRLSLVATPLVMHGLYEFGCYGDWIDRTAPTSHSLRVLLAVLPLYLAELPRLMIGATAEALLEADFDPRSRSPLASAMMPRWPDVWPWVRLRLGWPTLALLPIVLLGVCLDVLQLHRGLYVAALATSFGSSLATVAFLTLAALLLPWWFRVAFGTRRRLPEPVGTVLRSTAARLGFPPRRVLMLPTGMRAMNAMMVGPLPVGRTLCLTDALLATLDSRSLTGVLAHEIGHARMGHPGILMSLAVLLPLLFLAPLHLLEPGSIGVVAEISLFAGAAIFVWLSVRSIAHRFEHEADVASVRWLGVEPCSRALLVVSRLAAPAVAHLPSRLWSMHPDERLRLDVMRRYDLDPAFRERFDRRGRVLRWSVAAAVVLAVVVAILAWRVDWRFERIVVRFYTGDFVAARTASAELGDVPERWAQPLRRLSDELAVAERVAPTCRDWDTARATVPAGAWQGGLDVLRREGPAAARPWLALANAFRDRPAAIELALEEYCQAVADADFERRERVLAIVRRLGVPDGLEAVFADQPWPAASPVEPR